MKLQVSLEGSFNEYSFVNPYTSPNYLLKLFSILVFFGHFSGISQNLPVVVNYTFPFVRFSS